MYGNALLTDLIYYPSTMLKNHFRMKAKVWQYPGMAGWHFLSLPKKQSKEIKSIFEGMSRGWGSLPVNITIGKSKWKTSIFPDKKSGTYLLPLKSEIRKKENITEGKTVSFSLEIRI